MHQARTEAAAGLVFVAIGSNLGHREALIDGALGAMESTGVARIIQRSRVIETAAVDGPANQPLYLNGVVRVATTHDPLELLAELLRIETQFGRVRHERNAPRTLDLDLLLYGSLHLVTPDLTLPHPRMWTREFVMRPLAEVCDSAWLASMRAGYVMDERKDHGHVC